MAAFAPGQNDSLSVPEQMQQYAQQLGTENQYWPQNGHTGIL
jgi:hypothetical protein